MSVKERLTLFAKSKKKSVRAFEIECGLIVGYTNSIRVSMQPDKVRCITSHYPDLNSGWLLTGEGEMLKKNKDINIDESKLNESSNIYDKIDKDELILELRGRIKFQEGIITELLTKLK